ncbi:hypothetical protein [Oryza sativa Japonica Group]|uniref:Uncharacterized protein n=1 Tax=Oryza sativa subsp. japonica TaxID=39947 RepID=Q656V5_ORYSJ|nr:hypothetical protein [Oryza sativa Japonica Group]BAD52557.1 hypothetical protein [Oryza sativa Japonica Group]
MRDPRVSDSRRERGGWQAGPTERRLKRVRERRRHAGPTGSDTRGGGKGGLARLGFKAGRPSMASDGGTRGRRRRQPAARTATADGAKSGGGGRRRRCARGGRRRTRKRGKGGGGGVFHRGWPARVETTANDDDERREDDGDGRTISGRT